MTDSPQLPIQAKQEAMDSSHPGPVSSYSKEAEYIPLIVPNKPQVFCGGKTT